MKRRQIRKRVGLLGGNIRVYMRLGCGTFSSVCPSGQEKDAPYMLGLPAQRLVPELRSLLKNSKHPTQSIGNRPNSQSW